MSADSPPWRPVVASWPDDRRELWGLRSNALESQGTAFPASERIAFEELNETAVETEADHLRDAPKMIPVATKRRNAAAGWFDGGKGG